MKPNLFSRFFFKMIFVYIYRKNVLEVAKLLMLSLVDSPLYFCLKVFKKGQNKKPQEQDPDFQFLISASENHTTQPTFGRSMNLLTRICIKSSFPILGKEKHRI